jgi:AhpD family alkylhydroperoxidase
MEGVVREFGRRTYRGLTGFLEDIRFLVANRSLVKQAMRSGVIDLRFRERLMMVVTQVNGCRYCSKYHAAKSVKAGLPDDELHFLLEGQIPQDSPVEELAALAYARHWAETDGRPDSEAVRRLVETYHDEKAGMIHAILRVIRAGNLMGNTLDYFISRLSFGRFGLTARDRTGVRCALPQPGR